VFGYVNDLSAQGRFLVIYQIIEFGGLDNEILLLRYSTRKMKETVF
jgi:hypothetical protein